MGSEKRSLLSESPLRSPGRNTGGSAIVMEQRSRNTGASSNAVCDEEEAGHGRVQAIGRIKQNLVRSFIFFPVLFG